MELIGISPELNLYDSDWPIWTHQKQVPPAKFVFDDDGRRGMAVDSMVSGGSIISGSSKSPYWRSMHSISFGGCDESRRVGAVVDEFDAIKEGLIVRIPPSVTLVAHQHALDAHF